MEEETNHKPSQNRVVLFIALGLLAIILIGLGTWGYHSYKATKKAERFAAINQYISRQVLEDLPENPTPSAELTSNIGVPNLDPAAYVQALNEIDNKQQLIGSQIEIEKAAIGDLEALSRDLAYMEQNVPDLASLYTYLLDAAEKAGLIQSESDLVLSRSFNQLKGEVQGLSQSLGLLQQELGSLRASIGMAAAEDFTGMANSMDAGGLRDQTGQTFDRNARLVNKMYSFEDLYTRKFSSADSVKAIVGQLFEFHIHLQDIIYDRIVLDKAYITLQNKLNGLSRIVNQTEENYNTANNISRNLAAGAELSKQKKQLEQELASLKNLLDDANVIYQAQPVLEISGNGLSAQVKPPLNNPLVPNTLRPITFKQNVGSLSELSIKTTTQFKDKDSGELIDVVHSAEKKMK